MSRTEIRDALKAAGIFDKTGNRDQLWVQAFAAYFKETRRKLSMSCGNCYNTVRSWLNS